MESPYRQVWNGAWESAKRIMCMVLVLSVLFLEDTNARRNILTGVALGGAITYCGFGLVFSLLIYVGVLRPENARGTKCGEETKEGDE